MNATTTKTVNSTTAPNTAAAAQACCQGANDAFKAGVEANQKMFGAFTNAFTKGWNPAFGMDGFTAPATMIPAAFDKMAKAMNTIIDSNARFATECNALMIDAVRTNARTIERTGDMMLNQFMGHFTGQAMNPAANKNAKPVAETAREIFDEACGFTTKVGERVMKMNTDHVQNVAHVMDEVLTHKA